jgi:transcriptional regulator with XRE-family HTH domain
MSFSENLQYLRKKEELTQEQFAERLDISRQAVSKWESGQSYPEMDKLLQISEIFHCDLTQLVQGDVSIPDAEDAHGYDQFMNRYSYMITGAVSLILSALTLMSFLEGVVNEDILSIFFIAFVAAAVAIMVVSRVNREYFVKRYPEIQNFYTEEVQLAFNRRFAVAIASGICLILFGICIDIAMDMLIIAYGDQLSNGIFLLCVTIAAGLFTYFGMQKDKYNIEKYNKKSSGNVTRGKTLTGKTCGVIMLLATAVFFYLGLVHNMFHISWVAFIIGGIFCAIAAIVLVDKK